VLGDEAKGDVEDLLAANLDRHPRLTAGDLSGHERSSCAFARHHTSRPTELYAQLRPDHGDPIVYPPSAPTATATPSAVNGSAGAA
jgi:hypothetical protein